MYNSYNNNGYNNGGYNNPQQQNNGGFMYNSNPGNYNSGSIFNGNNGGFNGGYGNNNGYNNGNGIASWFMSNLNSQLWNLVNRNEMPQELVNPMMEIGKRNPNDFVKFIDQECRNRCGTDIENADNNVIAAAFGSIIAHMHRMIMDEQNRRVDGNTNMQLNALYNGGGNRFGGQPNNGPMPIQYNNGMQQGNNYGNVIESDDIPARYRTAPKNNNQAPQQPMDDPFARYAQPVNQEQQQMPADQPAYTIPKIKFKKTNILEIVGRAKSTVRVPSKPFEGQNTDGWSTALSECAAEKVDAGDAKTAGDIVASSVFSEYGIDLPIKNEESSIVSKQCVINSANLGEEYAHRYNETPRNDTRIVDVTGDNIYGLESDEVSIIKVTNNGSEKTIVCADLSDNTTSVEATSLFDSMRDGTIIDSMMARGAEAHRCMSDSSDVAFTVTYNTVDTLGIPVDVMKPVYEDIKKLCAQHDNISTFDAMYDKFITMLYDMPRCHSEMLDDLITSNINEVLTNNAFIFSDGFDKPIRISRLINVYDLLSNNNIIMLKTEYIAKFKRLVLEVLKDTFGGELLDPDNDYAIDYILDNEITAKAVVAYHKGAITSEDYHSWDEVSDRDLIAKLSANIRKFTAITMRRHALITTVQPAVTSNLTDWLFVYGDRSNHTTTNIDPMTMLIARTLDKFPTATDIRFINRKTGGSMGSPVGDGAIGSTLDGYYGYMLTK